MKNVKICCMEFLFIIIFFSISVIISQHYIIICTNQHTTPINNKIINIYEWNGIEKTRTNDVYQMESIDKSPRVDSYLALISACACRKKECDDRQHSLLVGHSVIKMINTCDNNSSILLLLCCCGCLHFGTTIFGGKKNYRQSILLLMRQ